MRIYDWALSEPELRRTMNASFPMAVTEGATDVGANDAMLNGAANANGGEAEYFFEYGPTKSYGSLVVGEELGSNREEIEISEAIVDLTPEATYHYRLVADSPVGTAYVKDQTLATKERTMTVGEKKNSRAPKTNLSSSSARAEQAPVISTG